YLTVRGNIGYMQYSPTLRFTLFGTLGFTLTVLFAAVMSFFGVGRILQFTLAVEGFDMLALYGFFSMTMFGAFYFIAPRVTRCEWLSSRLIRFHFWTSAYGIITLVSFMIIGGAAQGGAQARWDAAFKVSVEFLNLYIVAQCLGWGLILLSNLIFLFHVLLMAVRLGRRTSTGPTLIHDLPEEGDHNASSAKA
ncbi:MAG: cbb3-type cytochrome c oxidase subunit I, partial [Verrucomicrobiales bacterium]